MSDLTDLEICKRIAEIEGYTTKSHEGYECCAFDKEGIVRFIPFNPFDDALNHALMLKYKVCLMHYEEYTTARIWGDPEDNPIADFSTINNDTNTNRAILLAIIEANKGQL